MYSELRYLPNDNNWMVINRGIRYKITHNVVVLGLAMSSLYLVTQYIPLSVAEAQTTTIRNWQFIDKSK
jgi:hypothetical protein